MLFIFKFLQASTPVKPEKRKADGTLDGRGRPKKRK